MMQLRRGRIDGVQHLPARVHFVLDVVRGVCVGDTSLAPYIIHLTDSSDTASDTQRGLTDQECLEVVLVSYDEVFFVGRREGH
jgi:hypothetical protein